MADNPALQGQTGGQPTAPSQTAEQNTAPKKDAAPSSSDTEAASKLLAGKFKNKEAMDKAKTEAEAEYQRVQAELNKAKQELAELRKGQAAKPAAEGEQPADQTTQKEAPNETAEQKSVRMGESLMAEYLEKGAISDASKAKIAEELGLPASVVADFEKYLSAQKDAGLKTIKDTFADLGEFDVNAVIDNMSKTLPAKKLQAIQDLIDGGDIEVLRPYIKAHIQAQLPAGQVGRAGSTPVGSITSREQYVKAISDPRFDGDREYRAKLAKDLAGISPQLQRAWSMGRDA